MFVAVIDFESPVPYHQQLTEILRSKISNGEYTSRLPSIVALSQEYEVSKNTAVHALQTLRDEGLIISTRKGYYLASRK